MTEHFFKHYPKYLFFFKLILLITAVHSGYIVVSNITYVNTFH